ncbi:MAG: helix-turn-helix domain-containing protein [Ekhidna sp.]
MLKNLINKLDEIEKSLFHISIKIKVDVKPVYTPKDVAKILDVSVQYVYQLMSKGEIDFHKPGGKKAYFSAQHIQDYAFQNHCKSRRKIYKEAVDYVNNEEGGNHDK